MPNPTKTRFTAYLNLTEEFGDACLTRDGEDIEFEFDVGVTIYPGHSGTFWDPPESAQIEVDKATYPNGKPMRLSGVLEQKLSDQAHDRAADGDFDPDDY
jgi:hypothetical protein